MDPASFLSLDPWTLFLGLVFGAIGFGYFRYGKREGAIGTLIAGIALMAFPIFVSSPVMILVIGVALMAGPVVARRFGS